jgi:hypothetical protein
MTSSTNWTRVAPLARSIELPDLPKRIDDYVLAYDDNLQKLVYATSPDHHQWGHAWTWDGAAWSALSTKTARVGSAQQAWTGDCDPARKCVVAWTFDGYGARSAAIGVALLGDADGGVAVLAPRDHRLFGDHEPRRIVLDGEPPHGADDNGGWEHLGGVFGVDHERGVTVCVTRAGIWELAGTRWSRCADVDLRLVPNDVDGNRAFGGGGAGAVWDERRRALLFWFYDMANEKLVVLAWDATNKALSLVDAGGLPDEIHRRFGGRASFGVGGDRARGLVVYVAPKLFALGARGFDPIAAPDENAPPRAFAARIAAFRGSVVIGPHKTDIEQRTFHFLDDEHGWSKQGTSVKKSVLAGLSSGYVGFAKARDGLYAVGLYLNTVRLDDAGVWREIVDVKSADEQRDEQRVQLVLPAFGGALFAVLGDGAVLRLDGNAWTRVTKSSPELDFFFPLGAFDEQRNQIVVWGSSKKSGGRKNDTFLFDGSAWKKAKKAAKPADSDDKDAHFDVYWDPRAARVTRLGKSEIAWWDGAQWNGKKLQGGAALGDWRRTVCAGDAGTLVVNEANHSVVRVEDGVCRVVGAVTAPHPSAAHNGNLAYDRVCADGTLLWAFFDDDASAVFHTDLASLR